mmetsp:Transcript_8329/g.12089  ORF Transcript_8329/g.12089 Transcript_8329/m.12089 type:complete len:277 (+) Transcript_8329:146-976(+)|eukprot:CAMPEP_0194214144 /NCGR_PEP_ID=MMETSP0156-20130528/15241_1 /TAXON_ID=33649 /ORGANISM="Thalassionema nitzschioides, Strain L26-B" /LENGTH=276 /DNA_ID=CAMNT_0038942349 /DNA_START=140 /DNA_END=970 /DNA_ORIENTATION=-
MSLQVNTINVDEVVPDTSAISSSWMVLNVDFTTPNEECVENLKRVWDQVVSESFPPSSKGNAWWERLVRLHSATDRAYHTLMHLKEMIGFLKILGSTPFSTLLLEKKFEIVLTLSIFFHDAVYNAKSASNEEDSALLFQEFCSDMGGFKKDYKDVEDNVVKYILATKLHKLPEIEDSKNESKTDLLECLKLFLDIDMAVLGKRESAYLNYAGLIRQEYSFVEHDAYCQKRADILEAFLKEKIYLTQIMRSALEDTARFNLRKEIEFLRKGIIPGEN